MLQMFSISKRCF